MVGMTRGFKILNLGIYSLQPTIVGPCVFRLQADARGLQNSREASSKVHGIILSIFFQVFVWFGHQSFSEIQVTFFYDI